MGRELFTREWYLQDGDQVHGPNGNLLVLRLFLVISSWGGGLFSSRNFSENLLALLTVLWISVSCCYCKGLPPWEPLLGVSLHGVV